MICAGTLPMRKFGTISDFEQTVVEYLPYPMYGVLTTLVGVYANKVES